MNNKGFAITGIIYTLFILFLMILLTVLTGLSSYQKLMINSTRSLEDDFEGKEIETTELEEIKTTGDAKYLGKYIFQIDTDMNGSFDDDMVCSAYLNKGTNFKDYTAREFSDNNIYLSPRDCNDYNVSIELIKIYSFEGDN